MEHTQTLYRLIDAHPKYGEPGRSYSYDAWRTMPFTDRPLFEKINPQLSDYTLKEIMNGRTMEVYLVA